MVLVSGSVVVMACMADSLLVAVIAVNASIEVIVAAVPGATASVGRVRALIFGICVCFCLVALA